MRSVIFGVVGFAAGAVCGYFYAKKKFSVASEEIETEEEETEDNEESDDSEPIDESPPILVKPWNPYEKPDILSYSRIIKTNNYSTVEEEKPSPDIYVIEPDEFGQFEDYSENYMTYYADGYLVPDEDDRHPIEDKDEQLLLGFSNWRLHIGDYEDSIVHVRNDILKADYEIAQSNLTFHDPADEED